MYIYFTKQVVGLNHRCLVDLNRLAKQSVGTEPYTCKYKQ